MTAEAQILAELRAIREKVDRLTEPKLPPLTRGEFGKRVGRNRGTIAQMINDGRIRTENNRIPYSELKKFLS